MDWVLNGNPEAMNRLIHVEVKNASGDRKLYDRVYEYLDGEIGHLEAVRHATASDVLRDRAARGISRLERVRDDLPFRKSS